MQKIRENDRFEYFYRKHDKIKSKKKSDFVYFALFFTSQCSFVQTAIRFVDLYHMNVNL